LMIATGLRSTQPYANNVPACLSACHASSKGHEVSHIHLTQRTGYVT